MAEIVIRIFEQYSRVPEGKITLDEQHGRVCWKFVPIADRGGVRSGEVKVVGKDSVLNFTGQHAGKNFGKLIGFIYPYSSRKLSYTFVSGGKGFRCEFEEGFDFDN